MTICKDCKLCVIGKYSKVYGGCPIGCNKPKKSKSPKQMCEDGEVCFERREK